MPIANGMALPRPTLLAIAGAMLSLMSFTAMRTIGAQTVDDPPLPPPPAAESASAGDAGTKQAAVKPAPEPEPRLEDVPPAVSDALAGGKLVVLLFSDKGAADDAATAGHYGSLSRIGGVRVFRAGIRDVRRYAGIVAQVGVSQAPAAIIVRPDLTALPPIEGYVDSQFLVQRVRDQLR